MKLSRKLALAVLPLAILAGCTKTGASKGPETVTAPQQQLASVEVFAASNATVKGYRPVKLSETQTIYVAQEPVLTRAELAEISSAKDNQGRSYVRLGLNQAGVAAISKVPANRGFVTVIGGQVASLSGVRDANNFLFLTRDEAATNAIIEAVTGQKLPAAKK